MAATASPPPLVSHAPTRSHASIRPAGQQLAMQDRRQILGGEKGRVRVKRKAQRDTLLGSLCAQICEHQIGISVNLVLLVFLTHVFFPRARRRTAKFFHLSYYNPDTQLYATGTDDLPFVALWMVVFTGLRVAVMEYLLDPLARMGGIDSRRGLVRFKEQAWLIVYYAIFWPLGMYVMYHSEFWFNLHGLWQGWPHREVNGLFKWYYLVQWAFYLQQILVVNIEEKRKDYAQMFTHHIITGILIFLSYGYHHMRVGTVILVLMDLVDIILPTAKLLKYLGYSTACDVAFGVFIVAWFVTRHVCYLLVCWSIYAHAPVDMAPGCYFADGSMVPATSTAEYQALGGDKLWTNILRGYTDKDGPICWNVNIRFHFLAFLLSLQVIIMLWFTMIVRVAYRVLTGKGAEDSRSDDEGEDSEIDVDEEEAKALDNVQTGHEWAPIEQEVDAEDVHAARRSSPGVRHYRRSSNRSSNSRASGISIASMSDKKELLNRIGCETKT